MKLLLSKFKNKKKINTLLIASALIPTSSFAIGFLLNPISKKANIKLENKSLQALTDDISKKEEVTSVLPDLNKTDTNSQLAVPNKYTNQPSFKNLANQNGPILSLDDNRSVGAFDWFGNVSWFITLNSANEKEDAVFSIEKFSNNTIVGLNKKDVGTKFIDWAYNANADLLYLLTDTSYMFLVQSQTGILNNYTKINSGTKITKLAFIDFNQQLVGWEKEKQKPSIYYIDAQRLTLKETKASSSNEGLDSNDYLLDLLPVGVAYNVAVTSQQKPDDTTNITKITLKLAQDDLSKFSHGGKTQDIDSISNKKFKDIYTNSFHINNNNHLIIVYNKVFNLNLNRNTPSSSSFSEVNNMTDNTQGINSAYKDENNGVYIKPNESTKIYRVNANATRGETYVDLITNAANVFPQSSSTNADAKTARIFPVLTTRNRNTKTGIANTGYVIASSNFAATGYQNGSVINQNFTGTNRRPNFFLNGVGNLTSSQSPSIVTFNNIRGSNENVVGVINQNTDLFSNDINGELYIKASLVTASWYDLSSNARTVSNVLGKWNFAKIADIAKFAPENVFKSVGRRIFSRLDPNQITERQLNRYALQILNLPVSVLTSSERNIQIVVKERKPTEGKIKLAAVVTYLNQKGQRVSFIVDDQEYTVQKEAANYKFQFAGTDKELSQESNSDFSQIQTVDVNTLPDNLDKFKKLIPSFVNPNDIDLAEFIAVQDKYPTDARRVFRISSANDSNGSLVLEVLYNNLERQTPAYFAIRYTGFQTLNSSRINFQGNNASSQQTSLIPQSLQEQDKALFEKEKAEFDKKFAEAGSPVAPSYSFIIRPKPKANLQADSVSITTNNDANITRYEEETILTSSSYKFEITPINVVDFSVGKTTSYNLNPLSITTVGKYVEYDKKLATETSDDDISEVYSSQLTQMGFKPSIKVVKQENGEIKDAEAEIGSVLVEIDFSNSRSEELGIDFPLALFGDKFGLMNGKIYQRYVGFLPIGATYGVKLLPYESEQIQTIVQKHNVNAPVTIEELLSTLDVRGYLTETKPSEMSNSNETKPAEIDPESINNIRISGFRWEGEDLKFNVFAQSKRYASIRQNSEFTISWSPKFASIRARNLAASVGTAVLGVSVISSAVGFYIFRRNRIRRMMK